MSYAGFWRRAGAVAIDAIIFAIGIMLLFGNLNSHADNLTLADISRSAVEPVYTILFWVFFSGTPGKLLLGCYVVNADTGEPIGFKQAIIRYLGYYVSFLSLGIGFLWVVWDKRKQGFHDKLANTVVKFNGYVDVYDESQKSLRQLISEVR